jgi:dihydroflavonol-4-reductase
MTKALVLGATGFLGGHIALTALQSGWEVYAFRRDPQSQGYLEGIPVQWVEGNLHDPLSLEVAMNGVDVVFHAAAFYPTDGNPRKVPEFVGYATHEIQNVLNACHKTGVNRLVYTSSLTTIGAPPENEDRLANESDFYIPGTLAKSAYYEAKILMEKAVLDAAAGGLESVVLNPSAMFGPGDVHLTMGGLLIAVARGMVPVWLPGIINVVDVRDVATAHLTAAERGSVGERYIIGGYNYTVREALTQTANVAGVRPPRFGVPLWMVDGITMVSDLLPFLGIPTNHLRAVHLWQGYNTEKARDELGFNPRPFEETVKDSLDWFRSMGHL